MTRRGWALTALAVVAGVVAVGVVITVRASTAKDTSCQQELQADEAKVRTDRWQQLTDDLPGIGDYAEIHWQLRAPGNPCARAPGPADRDYEGIVRLRPQDARALAAGYGWQPMSPSPSPAPYQWDTPAQMWPALVPFAPAEPHWLHSQTYADTQFQHDRWGDLYLDPVNGFAFFVLLDH